MGKQKLLHFKSTTLLPFFLACNTPSRHCATPSTAPCGSALRISRYPWISAGENMVSGSWSAKDLAIWASWAGGRVAKCGAWKAGFLLGSESRVEEGVVVGGGFCFEDGDDVGELLLRSVSWLYMRRKISWICAFVASVNLIWTSTLPGRMSAESSFSGQFVVMIRTRPCGLGC
jgi:hypothetical protein